MRHARVASLIQLSACGLGLRRATRIKGCGAKSLPCPPLPWKRNASHMSPRKPMNKQAMWYFAIATPQVENVFDEAGWA